ncbi:MAG: putative DNA binding domain-containing protein [Candidatus Kerfeldbacteria bacterium]|nr:putative DNA binding domain-containing protein [Candidatus Kerfeldbacteria bacterium]
MTISEIEKLIDEAFNRSSETISVEFKDARGGRPSTTWRTVSSFSHKPGGGLMVFGVVDNKEDKIMEVVGITDIAQLQEKIGDLVNNEMSFTIRPAYHIIERDGKTLLAVYIPECPDQFKPCYYKPKGLPSGACIRDGNTDRTMTEEEMRHLIDNSKKLKFDTTKAEDTTLDGLSKEKILGLVQRSSERTHRDIVIEDVNFELMKNLGIVDTFDGEQLPTVGGFLIFAKDRPQNKQNFSRYIVRCVRYKGSNVATDIIDKMDIDGTLDTQIDAIQKFVLRNIKRSAEIIGTKRVEKYEYPEKAIREIVANAIIHRDYRITETYTQVNIFEDRIEVFNPGSLPPGVTVENIKDAQASRNEMIAARLKELDYLEEYGRGIDIVFNTMKQWNLIPPIFKNTVNSFKVILMGEKLSSLNERQVAIWNYLIENKRITAKECEQILTDTPRPTINYDLAKMQKMGLIHQLGETRGASYEANF